MGQTSGTEPVYLRFQYDKTEYVRGMRFYLRKSYLVSWVQAVVLVLALVAVLGIMVYQGRPTFFSTFVLVLLVLVAGYGIYLYSIKPARLFRKDPRLAQPVNYCFSVEDIARQDEEAAALLDWDVKKLWRSREFYYLFNAAGGYTMLPRRAFWDEKDQERFEKLVLEVNPDTVFKTYA